MRGVIMESPGIITVAEREDPQIVDATDAVIIFVATCVCGSDLWRYRGVVPADHTPMGHEYVGVVEEVGADVKTVKPGDFVVGSFCISCGTCKICLGGYPSRCVNGQFVGSGTQAERAHPAG